MIDHFLDQLYRRINYERQTSPVRKGFELANMRQLVNRLGSPHLACPVVHVAGTKGKGSVCCMVGAILHAAGFKVGIYTSPHLETIHQRMVIGDTMITGEQLEALFTQVMPQVEALDDHLVESGKNRLTFFEVTTAMAFQFFAKQQCDVVVLETGLGGRLDSTNICQPVVSIITNISRDHTKLLGERLHQIAFEKAGIIKPGIPVVSGVLNPEAQPVILDVSQQRGCPLYQLDQDFILTGPIQHPVESKIEDSPDTRPNTSAEQQFVSSEIQFGVESDRLAINLSGLFQNHLRGRHQRENAALAVAAAGLLRQQGWEIPNHAIQTGLKNAKLAGRTEVVNGSPVIVMDMGHNPASVEALAAFLTQELPLWKTAKTKTLIFATTKEKDCRQMFQILLPLFDQVVFTKYQNNPRGQSIKKMQSIVKDLALVARQGEPDHRGLDWPSIRFSSFPTPEQAWRETIATAERDDLVCLAGSAFLLAELRPHVIANQAPAHDEKIRDE